MNRPSEAGQAAQFGQGDANVAFSQGVVQPGMGMAPTLRQQLGSNIPGEQFPVSQLLRQSRTLGGSEAVGLGVGAP